MIIMRFMKKVINSEKHYLVSITRHDVPVNVSNMVKYINN